MVVTNHAKNKIMLLFTGSNLQTGSEYITHFIIGKSGLTASATQTELGSAFDRQILTSKTYLSPTKVTFQGDWGQNEVSGLSFFEFGLIGSATGITGSIWDRTVLSTALTFDGTNELRIENSWEVF